VGAKETLRQCLRSFHVSWLQVTAVGWVSPPFYSASAPDNRVGNRQIYLFTPTTTSHNGKVSKGQNTSFTRIRASVGRPWEFRSPFFALWKIGRKFGPSWGRDDPH
jgi:hypothetical protein